MNERGNSKGTSGESGPENRESRGKLTGNESVQKGLVNPSCRDVMGMVTVVNVV